MRLRASCLSAFMSLLATVACAAVQTAPNGFVVRHEATLNAPPAKVYEALLAVGAWWDPAHTFSGDSKNLSIDARAGGCFCERLADGGGVEHMRVVYLAPGKALRMSGGLGPLQGSGLAGAMTWALAPAGNGTKLQLTYSVGGFMEGGFEKMAPAVEDMLGHQLARLKLLVDTGSPVAKQP
ncbi:MAG: SRPBCC family protein [Ramlibacter sp.]